jgi:hypothetical protein
MRVGKWVLQLAAISSRGQLVAADQVQRISSVNSRMP